MLLGRELTAVAAAAKALVPRVDTSCPNSYTAQNGLQFNTVCGFDLPCPTNSTNCDIPVSDTERYYTGVSTFAACQEICANKYLPCYGVAYDATHSRCWIKGSAISADYAQKNGYGYTYNSALANRAQLATPANTDCPASNNSTVTSSDGAAYQLFCSSDLPGYDLNFRPHADTLDQCLNYCAASHPLCDAVAWNVGRELGYANCFLKGNINYTVTPQAAQRNVEIHFARLLPSVSTQVNTSIPSSGSYTSNGLVYSVQQNAGRSGTSTLSSFHADNVTACIDGCARNSTCQGVNFDWSLLDGYQNCYLLNNTGSANGNGHYSFAQKTGTSSGGSDGGSGSGSSSDGGSKAWIAGAVIGPIALIAIIVAAVLLWRRRQRHKNVATLAAAHPVDEKRPYQPQPPYGTGEVYAHEMPESANIYEMPGSNTGSKYPQEMNGGVAATELPAGLKH